jgi:myo-inositol-1(or 4)-monophosphatase
MSAGMAPRSAVLETMIRAAREAAEGLVRDFGRRESLQVEEKKPSDFVSSADLRSQEVLRAALSHAYPDHALLLEERTDQTGPASARARFLVDPLDGTTNFLRGVPHFAIAIAHEVDGELTEGVVLDVAKGELFWAERGGGAWLGDRKLAVAPPGELAHAVVGTGIPHHGSPYHGRYLDALGRVMPEVAGIRRIGSAALDLCYVAAGRFDAFFEIGLSPWDVGAGSLLVREAGGTVTKVDGTPTAVGSRDILATAGASLHGRLVALLEPLHGAASAPPS